MKEGEELLVFPFGFSIAWEPLKAGDASSIIRSTFQVANLSIMILVKETMEDKNVKYHCFSSKIVLGSRMMASLLLGY